MFSIGVSTWLRSYIDGGQFLINVTKSSINSERKGKCHKAV